MSEAPQPPGENLAPEPGRLVATVEPLQTGSTADAPKKSYGQILKSSALIGGSTAFSMLLAMVRTKAMALLLGPAGIGLVGVYSSISELVRSIAGLGIKNSGVRQIAEAVGSGDSERIARTVTTLRRVALYSGTMGAILLVIFCRPVSWVSFGTYERAGAVALLALVALFMDISDGQAALVQGMRRVADLARMNVLAAFYGTVFGVAIVYFWREQGLVPALICVAAMSILTSWWYARKVRVKAVDITWKETYLEASGLVKLGVVFMVSGLSTQGSVYLSRLIVLHEINLEAAGYYNAAWGLAGMSIGFILQAMGTDFYPRLTAIVQNKQECVRLVNEQVEVGLLMAGPGILGALSFAPLVITLFYSAKFGQAVPILQWFCVGMLLRVITWPMAFIMLAKGDRKLFFWTEIFANGGYVVLVWLGVKAFKLPGSGIAFFAMNAGYYVAIYIIARRLTDFRWSPQSRRLGLIFIPLVAVVFLVNHFLSLWTATAVGAVITTVAGIYALKTLCHLIPYERLPGPARKLLKLLKLADSA